MTNEKDTNRAIAALRTVENGKAWDRASAYVIVHPNGKQYGKVKCAWPADGMGPLHVFMWDCNGTGIQYGKASGCGYDKLTAALSGMTFDGITLRDHCGTDDATEKLLAAHQKASAQPDFDTALGDPMDKWRKKAAKLGAQFANWNAEKSHYTSLYVAGGLDRLKMAGYQVIQAL
jgi:hypothetical protein